MQCSDESDDDFLLRYLAPALDEALTGRDLEVTQLRFGLSNGDALTLAEIGAQFSVSRERIRQIIDRALSRVRQKAKRELKRSNESSFSAQLIVYIEQFVRPNDEGCIKRLLRFCEDSLNHLDISKHAVPLIASLIFPARVCGQIKADARQHVSDSRRVTSLQYQQTIRSSRVAEAFQNLTNYITWHKPQDGFRAVIPLCDKRARNVSDEAKNSGSFYSQKLEREVQYESKLELNFYNQLESADDVIWYQEQPFGIPYSFNGYERTYFPDVLVELQNQRYVVVEIKPCFLMPLEVNRWKWNSLHDYCAQRGWGVLITDGRKAIQQLRELTVNKQFEGEILNRLESTSLTYPEYKKIAEQHNVSSPEFLALVLREELNWKLDPFNLSGK